MDEVQIWKPVEFNCAWLEVDTSRFDEILPRWLEQREKFAGNEEEYAALLEQLKRKHALETGAIEGIYTLDRGTTETLIKDGFVTDYIAHGSSTVQKNELMDYLKVQLEALDNIFDFIKGNRSLSISYIKQLHQLLTQAQPHTEAVDQFGNKRVIELLKGEFKRQENYPVRGDQKFLYCSALQTPQEIENLVNIFHSESFKAANAIIKAAWLHHAFTIIHPFQDGNGRMARLLASLVLIQENLFPLTIRSTNRKQYIDALEQADKGEYQSLVDLFIDDQLENINEVRLAIASESLVAKLAVRTQIAKIFNNSLDKFVSDYADAFSSAAKISRYFDKETSGWYEYGVNIEFEDYLFRIKLILAAGMLYAKFERNPESQFSRLEIEINKLDYKKIIDDKLDNEVKNFAQRSMVEALNRINDQI